MSNLLLYRFRYIIIIIAFIGFIAIGSIFTYIFDIVFPKSRWFNPEINIIFLIIRIIIMGIGIYLIEYWYNKKWGEAEKHYKQGVNLIEQREKEEFIESTEILLELEEAIKKNPYLWQAYFIVANIYYLCKEYDKALEYMKIVIRLKPKFGTAYFHFGKFLHIKRIKEIEKGIDVLQSGLYQEVIESYKKALKLRLSKEDRLQIHILFSEIYFQLGLIDDGKRELNEVLKRDPNNKIAHDYLNELIQKGFIEKKGQFSFS